ncbi:MAG TPA: thiol:disulfide interchange protein DsbA/DsbL [Candidatus Saccharimonadia bacterium]|nr:thiol:disulfide interchange protein DsbA/DsbL [Candidatus Saccharimonadia bacterium]
MLIRIAALLLTLFVVPTACGQATMVDRFRAGQHYQLIDPPVPSSAPAGKVEVVEVFSYACPHCATFQVEIDKWKPKAPAATHFVYLPAAWNSNWEAFARAYHAADSLGILTRSHRALFKAIHTDRATIRNIDDLSQWYTQFGVTKEQFLAAFNSPETTAKIAKARELVPAYKVDATPTMIVAGKYRITGEMAGSVAAQFQVVDYLIAKEAAAKK